MKLPGFNPDPAEIEEIMGSIAIQSTGNKEQDEAHLLDAAIREVRLRHDYCPNGCGIKLTPEPVLPGCRECVQCKFTCNF